MKLQLLDERLGVCRLSPETAIPSWASTANFFSLTRTADELSIVCPETFIPDGIQSEKGWRCLQVMGPLDFSLIGILSKLSGVLAEVKVSIFAISTFDTDYILVKATDLSQAVQALKEAGYEI